MTAMIVAPAAVALTTEVAVASALAAAGVAWYAWDTVPADAKTEMATALYNIYEESGPRPIKTALKKGLEIVGLDADSDEADMMIDVISTWFNESDAMTPVSSATFEGPKRVIGRPGIANVIGGNCPVLASDAVLNALGQVRDILNAGRRRSLTIQQTADLVAAMHVVHNNETPTVRGSKIRYARLTASLNTLASRRGLID